VEFGASSGYKSTAARNDASPFRPQPLAAGFHPSDEVGAGAAFEEVADILGNSPDIVRKHYAKWSVARQAHAPGRAVDRLGGQKDQVASTFWAQRKIVSVNYSF
jgi:hypothetical protein